MDKYYYAEMQADAVGAVVEMHLEKQLNKSQVSVQPVDAEGNSVTKGVTGTVEVQAYPAGVATKDAAYTQTIDLATATTVSLSGFFDDIHVTPTDLTGEGVAGYKVIVSQIVG
ncbi:hypothetical protein VH22019_00078 [Vibrio phage VH2_2019]|nr:hypothetical protein VH22019_00078 [Vibrio phage VH2_2019]